MLPSHMRPVTLRPQWWPRYRLWRGAPWPCFPNQEALAGGQLAEEPPGNCLQRQSLRKAQRTGTGEWAPSSLPWSTREYTEHSEYNEHSGALRFYKNSFKNNNIKLTIATYSATRTFERNIRSRKVSEFPPQEPPIFPLKRVKSLIYKDFPKRMAGLTTTSWGS